MRAFVSAAVAWGLACGGASAGTAYEALRVLGSARGDAVLNRVVQVEGRGGVPQPDRWVIVVEDVEARGGVREFEVRGKRIASERTPVRQTAGAPVAMDLSRLNLDSSGAFEVGEREAVRARVGFDSVDYLLRAEEAGKAPVWALRLADPAGRGLGVVEIAADTGRVLNPGALAGGRVRDVAGEEDEEGAARYEDDEEGGGLSGKLKRFGQRIERHFRKDAARLERFFTGRQTIRTEEE